MEGGKICSDTSWKAGQEQKVLLGRRGVVEGIDGVEITRNGEKSRKDTQSERVWHPGNARSANPQLQR